MATLSIVSPGLTYSDETLQLQSNLNELGYSITIDGLFGPETQQVVMSFQQSVRIEADGIAGPITLSAIQSALQTWLHIKEDITQNQPINGEWPAETRFLPQSEPTISITEQLAGIDWKWVLMGVGIVMMITYSMRKR